MKTCKKCGTEFTIKSCPTCAKEYRLKTKARMKKYKHDYYVLNKEKIKQKTNQWVENNKDRRAANQRKYVQNHPQEVRLAKQKWDSNNQEKKKIINSLYQKKHPVRILMHARNRQIRKLQSMPLWASGEFDAFVISEMYELSHMRTLLTGIEWQVDHIVPLTSKLVCGLHCASNLSVIPAKINRTKGNRYWPDMP